MNKTAWAFLLTLLAVIILTLSLGYGGVLMMVAGPQVITVSLMVIAYALMSASGVVD